MIKEGWLLYYKNKYEQNIPYCDLYLEASKKYAFNLRIIIFEDLTVILENNELCLKYNDENIKKPHFIINRTNNFLMAEMFEMHGITVFNNSYLSRLSNDKRLAYAYVAKLNIPIMKSCLYKDEKYFMEYPYIMKDCFGSGGKEVYLINNNLDEIKTNYKQIDSRAFNSINTTENNSLKDNFSLINKNQSCNFMYSESSQNNCQKNYLYQKVCNERGQDIRVYVVGKEIICAILRTGKNDFRSNYSLGGDISIFNLNEKLTNLVTKIISNLNVGMAGIDFLYSENDFIFNEIEDSVGARTLYKLTNINIVDMYCKYIKYLL